MSSAYDDPGEVVVVPYGSTVPAGLPDDTLIVFLEPQALPPGGVQYVPAPTPAQVAMFLSWPTGLDAEQSAQVQAAINAAQSTVVAYTRGVGFASGADGLSSDTRLGNVIMTLAARMANNPTAAIRLQAGNFTENPSPPGFLLHELLVLQEFRVLAA